MRFHCLVISFLAAAVLSGCARQATGPTVNPPLTSGGAVLPSQEAAFQNWLKELRREAATKGISQATLDIALKDVAPIPRVVELDRRQPEFTQTFWRYLDGAVSDARVKDGLARLAENRELLTRLEAKYGLPGRFLVAFWGMETNYGRNVGGYPVIGALATLAFDGRRSAFFRTELFNALTILDRGHITADKMIGSWAGAMGQTQFMPSTFLKHAVDETGDGHIDVWGQTPDALASGANYLRDLGWDPARTWGREVRLPANFDLKLASLDGNASETVKSLAAWAALGVTRADGRPLPRQDILAALILPAGVKGPAFLVYDNFRAILKWNRSTFYAVAVGYLADRISGAPALSGARVNDDPLSRDQVLLLQGGLKQRGFLDSEPDGVVGSATRQALRKYQVACGFPADGYASPAMVNSLTENVTCGSFGGGVAMNDSSR